MTANTDQALAAVVAYGDARAADQKALDDATIKSLQDEIAALKNPAPAAKFYVGGPTSGNGDPTPQETRAGAKYGIRRTYHAHDVAAVVKAIKANMAAGRAVSEVSMKVPDWAVGANGGEDAWAKDSADQIQLTILGTTHKVRVIINAEPENDGGGATARDNWKNMQTRLAPFFNRSNIDFGVCLMGWHQVGGLKALWALDLCVPKTKDVKFVSFDIYESYGTTTNGVVSKSWKDFEGTYIKPFATWAKANGKYLGMSETGVMDAAFTAKPTWFADMVALLKKYGWTSFSYFNSDLNSIGHWALDADSPREKAFLAQVKANKI